MDILFIFTYMQLYTHTHNVCEKINSFSSWDISDTLCWGNPLWLPCSHWVRGSARPPKERGWRAGAFGHCFPLWGPGVWPVSLSAIAASYSSEVFPPFLKELYSSPKISMMQSIFYITAHHHCHVQTTVGGTLPPPSWSPNFFPYFIFPIIATCVSVVK